MIHKIIDRFFAPLILILVMVAALSSFETALCRQPIIEDGKKTTSHGNLITYSNDREGVFIDYPAALTRVKGEGGIVTLAPKNPKGYRFIPSLCITKYYILETPDISDLLNQIETNFTGLPYYRLSSVNKRSNSEMLITREFVDNNSKESVYEVALYKKKGNDLFEAAFQVPRKNSRSEISSVFNECLESFRIAGEEITRGMSDSGTNANSESLKKAGELADSGKYLEALAGIAPLRASGSRGPEIYLISGKCHIGLRDYEKACNDYKNLVSLKKDSLEFRNLYVDSLIQAGKFKDALSECRKSFDIKSTDAETAIAFMNLGNIFLAMNRLREALNSFEEGISRFPKVARLHNNAALAAIGLGDLEAAKEHYEKALSIEPSYKNARIGLAKLFLRTENFTAADFHFNEALKTDPRCAEAYTGLLKVYKATGDAKKSGELLGGLGSKDPALYKEVTTENR